ncbi:MAG: 3-deoxy-manno-octulosonate-8-phosphatase [Candidatus Azambacteria bacterium GW2011_GWA2_42_9]|nr:MAG: 3-deoxy-manno-octulosonate-8-phosphatase [Candidatus Azambacteria bacterium GW2011_GWB1_42_17]KKS45761.1 MAG: 3-deoxy-manno-octulosonate-8-phosphatase [Candidatus Azambacteria bacterium GW2011_GWA1_42_19]KKS75170.1 MAG: 3-deoxy-manno-octulosonate-8-phosphatase [Candidatus Azambacteria bacterium GW2011_GWA2_42_9]KKS88179.1 MAG: 3-deoxy-manno-octulosonate-8-phosphatase [Parcubacteria group bacterium GW2011_GWC1_43_11]
MKNIYELAKQIKVVVFDFDGVFTDNSVLEGAPYKGKIRSHYDGQGVSLLRALGIEVAVITNETGIHAEPVVGLVEKWNNLPSAKKPLEDGGWARVELFLGMGGPRKVEAAEQFLASIDASFEECAAMGDDLVDVPLLRKVAFPVAPAQAEKVVKEIALFVTERPGGAGAVRDFVNFILRARGIDPTTLPFN